MAVWKYLPYEFFEVDAVEAWLDEQVSKGLSLQKINRCFCRFERTSAGMTRYRVNIKSADDLLSDNERIAAYREMGWEYVTPLTRKAEIYRALSPDAAELNTDEEVLNDALHTELRNQLIAGIFGFVVFLACVIYILITLSKYGLYACMLQAGFWGFFLLPIIFLYFALTIFSGIQPAIAIRKRKLLARDYHSSKIYTRRRLRHVVIYIVFALYTCFLFMNMNDQMNGWDSVDIADYRPPLSYEDFSHEEPKDAIDYMLQRKTFLQSTVLYEQHTELDSDTEIPQVPDFRYSVSEKAIRWQWLAANYAREYAEDWEPVEISGYDGAWYCDGEEFQGEQIPVHYQKLALLKNNNFTELVYNVPVNLTYADLRDGIPMLEH